MSNFGIGFGSFVDGLSRGAALGEQFRDIKNRREVRKIREQGLASADLEREHQITSGVQMKRPEQDGLAPIQFEAGGETFDSLKDARKAASGSVDSKMDIFMRDTAPKIREAYIRQGDLDKADSWQNWVEGETGKAALKDWSKSYSALQRKDYDAAAPAVGNYFTKYIDDSVTYQGYEKIKNEAGEVTGFEMTLKDKESGKVSKIPMSLDALTSGLMQYNPQNRFDSAYAQSAAADRARLADAKDQRKFDREQGGRMELERLKADLDRTSSGKAPAQVQMAQWLVDNGVASSAAEAWRLSKTAASKGRQEFALEYAKMATKDQDKYAENKLTPDQALDQGLAAFDRLTAAAERATPAPASASPTRAQVQGRPTLDLETNQMTFR